MSSFGWQEAPAVTDAIGLKRFLDDLLKLIKDYQTLGNNIIVRAGSGTPEGVITANVGSLFLRTDGGATTTLYVKTSGTGNTGWTAK